MLVDAGVNLLNGQFRRDAEEVIRRAHDAGVSNMLVIATDLDTSAAAIRFSQAHDLRCTVGVHPHDAAGVSRHWTDTLRQLAQHPRVCAIGETGLDFNRNYSPPDQQRAVFAAQIQIARELNKPLYLHDRESEGELLRLLQAPADLPPVLVHCFTGTARELESYLDAGFYIGVTGWVTDPKRGQTLRQLVPMIPLEKLVLETDAPFLRPSNVPADWHAQEGLPSRYKRRCEPAMLPYVLACVAQLRGESTQDIAYATSENTRQLFGIAAA